MSTPKTPDAEKRLPYLLTLRDIQIVFFATNHHSLDKRFPDQSTVIPGRFPTIPQHSLGPELNSSFMHRRIPLHHCL